MFAEPPRGVPDTPALSPSAVYWLQTLSGLLGWTYTLSWSLSFYPQPLLNLRRRSTSGTTPSFPALNLLGFTCYTVSTSAFYYSPTIRAQYAARNGGSEPTVRGNDLVFAVHALLLTAVTLSQFWPRLWGFEAQGGRRGGVGVGRGPLAIVVAGVVGVAWCVVQVLAEGGTTGAAAGEEGKEVGRWEWIDVVYAVGYVKLLVTVTKYIPQAWTNYQRKSTEGWSIWQILMDLLGGVLSMAQLVIDSSLQKDWSGLTGNPVKFGLGNVSVVFDVLFMTQHYVLYRGARGGKVKDEERRGLLDDDGEEGAASK